MRPVAESIAPSTPCESLSACGLGSGAPRNEQWVEQFRARALMDGATPGAELLLGRYRIVGEVGRGGQGIVYRASRESGRGDVAIKRMVAGELATDTMRRRFEREADAAASLDHPGIVRVLEATCVAGEPLLVMEWIDGVPIDRWLRESCPGGASEEQIVRLAVQVCDAVSHAHDRGVIHRDLKPANILVDAAGDARVLDFGLAKIMDRPAVPRRHEEITESLLPLGTLEYAAPEQFVGGATCCDVRSDVYSLGALLYRLLTGRSILGESTPAHVISNPARRALPQAISALRPGTPADLEAIVLKAAHPDRSHRYRSVHDLGLDLRRFLGGDSVTARRPGFIARGRDFVRRHRAGTSAAAAAFVLVVGCAVWTSAMAWSERAARRAAESAFASEQLAHARQARVTGFLQAMLESAQPARGGADVSMLSVLAQAADRARVELADDPAAASDVLYTIGQTYRSQWRFREGAAALESASELSRVAYGSGDERTARCLVALGSCLANSGQPRSVDVSQEALDIRLANTTSGNELLIAEARMRLGYSLYRAAKPPRWSEAEQELGSALSLYATFAGPHDRDTASCLHNLGYMRWRQGRRAEAADLYRRALHVFESEDARADPVYIEALTGYVALLEVLGRSDESLTRTEELIPLLRSRYGDRAADVQERRRDRLRGGSTSPVAVSG